MKSKKKDGLQKEFLGEELDTNDYQAAGTSSFSQADNVGQSRREDEDKKGNRLLPTTEQAAVAATAQSGYITSHRPTHPEPGPSPLSPSVNTNPLPSLSAQQPDPGTGGGDGPSVRHFTEPGKLRKRKSAAEAVGGSSSQSDDDLP